MTKHTPGPWKTNKGDWYVSGPDKYDICLVSDRAIGLDRSEQRANAELIARAPELEAENAELLAENAHLREIEAANKETIKYWRGQVAERDEQIERLYEVEQAAIFALGKLVEGKKNEALTILHEGVSHEAWPTSISEWVEKQESKNG